MAGTDRFMSISDFDTLSAKQAKESSTSWREDAYLRGLSDSEATAVKVVVRKKYRPGFSMRRSGSALYVINLVESGAGIFFSSGESKELGPGSICFFSPRATQGLMVSSDNPLVMMSVGCTGSQMDALFLDSLGAAAGAWRCQRPQEIASLLRTVFEVARSGDVLSSELAAAYLRVLLVKIKKDRTEASAYHIPGMLAFFRAKKFLEANCVESLSLSEVAGEVGVSEKHLTRLFQKFAGTTPYRYLTEIRMERAQFFLSSREETIAAIAASLGYQDAFGFSKAFRRFTGTNPSEFRAKASRLDCSRST